MKTKKRIKAFLMAALMVLTTVLGVMTPATVAKADETKTVIIHYNRPDGEYGDWDIWAWPKDGQGDVVPFTYDDAFGKVAVVQKTEAMEEMGFIIRKPDWSEKDVNADQFIKITGDVTEVWINSGVEGYLTEAPEGMPKFDVSTLGGNSNGEGTEGGGEAQAPAAGQVQVKLHYHRFDENYTGWDVWFWPDGGEGTATPFSESDDFGKVSVYNVDASVGKVGFIVRTQDWKKDVDADRFIDLSTAKDGVVDVYIIQADATIYTDKADADLSPKILSATLVTAKRIAMKVTVPVNTDATESLSAFKVVDQNGKEYELMNLFSEAGVASDFNINMKQPLDLNNTYKVVSTEYGEKALAYGDVYNTDEFNEAFYYEGNDLGATYSKDKTTFKVWSPFASEIKLNLYKDGLEGEAYETVAMTKGEKGVWSAEVTGDLNGVYYTYSVTNQGNTAEVVDLYARTTGANGKRGMVIDLKSTNPDKWDTDLRPELKRATDTMIYEMHVRDFTIDPSSGVKNAGKYLGLTERGTKNSAGVSTALDHIIDLGVTHVQLMPVYDYSPNSVDETKLDTPQFNWGYDPYNYNVPEGSYSTDPFKGEVRVKEFKQMVQAFHNNGIRVIMDVVYNHTAESSNSYMNLTVPGYYYRMNADGTFSNGSGCGNEVASERLMVRKYIVDSVVYWATEYHIDGFRFDLMALLDTETMKIVREELDKIDPTIFILGEGWTGGASLLEASKAALKKNTYKIEGQVAAFSDDIRDGIKGSVFNDKDQGFATGLLGQEERIKAGVVAATKYEDVDWNNIHTDINSPWAGSPDQTINYVSAHDNLTLWDKLALSNKDDSEEDRVKMNLLSASIVYTSQGIPFILSGEELLRSKDGDHNSYKSSDEINSIKWDEFTNTEVYEYYKGLIAFRKNHAGLRMTTTEDIKKYLVFEDELPANVVAYSIDGKAEGEVAEQLFIIYNANKEAVEINLPEGEWKVCIKDNKAGTDVIETVTGKVSVGAISCTALVKGETVDTSVGAGKDDKGGMDTMTIVLIVAAVVAVIAVIFFVIKSKKGSTATSAEEMSFEKFVEEENKIEEAKEAEEAIDVAESSTPVAETEIEEATDDVDKE